MPIFQYKARDRQGVVLTGTIDTASREAAADHLGALGYIPVRIEEKREGVLTEDQFLRFQRIRPEDLIMFSRQLATLVNAGIPFLTCMDTLAAQTTNKRLRGILIQVRKDVEGGSAFSDALAKHPKVFSDLYVGMIRAGEAAGVLDEILNRLAMLSEHEAETRQRVKAAVRYPIIVVVAICLAFAILVTFVIPVFAKMFAQFKMELPLPTRVLIGINTIVQNYGYLLLGAIVAAILGLRAYIKTERGASRWDNLKISFPILGVLFVKIAMSRFARIFATLYRSGLPMLQALDIVSGAVGNRIIMRAVERVRESAREGRGLADPMRASGVFPPLVVQMVATGEESGNLDEMLTRVSEYYDKEVEYSIRNLSTTIEPILLLVIGGMVLFLALAIFLPWWDMTKIARGGR